jgi:hypothetical protein
MFSSAQANTEYTGQLSGWGKLANDNDIYGSFGFRYVPEFYFLLPGMSDRFDMEISLYILTRYSSQSDESINDDFNGKLYRTWIRYTSAQTDVRLGLQRINFGPARILRSLRWFDQLDPRDPLQFTKGVKGIRYKYDAINNANLWFWGLYGNDATKGIEVNPTRENKPEFGGRIQFPLGNGEIGITTHFREVDLIDFLDENNSGSQFSDEQRIGIDGIFDIGIGIWFESVLVHLTNDVDLPAWTNMMTVGSDYTFPIGNGITTTFEHLAVAVDDESFKFKDLTNTSSVLVSYPLNWLDQFTFMALYQWNIDMSYLYLSWQRTYNAWTIHVSVFGSIAQQEETELNISGASLDKNGIQLMLIFNH